jgi:hypothetical protein
MSKIVDLQLHREACAPQNNYCYECHCGCQRFMLRPDAKTQCVECSEIKPRLIWGQFFVSDLFSPPDQT